MNTLSDLGFDGQSNIFQTIYRYLPIKEISMGRAVSNNFNTFLNSEEMKTILCEDRLPLCDVSSMKKQTFEHLHRVIENPPLKVYAAQLVKRAYNINDSLIVKTGKVGITAIILIGTAILVFKAIPIVFSAIANIITDGMHAAVNLAVDLTKEIALLCVQIFSKILKTTVSLTLSLVHIIAVLGLEVLKVGLQVLSSIMPLITRITLYALEIIANIGMEILKIVPNVILGLGNIAVSIVSEVGGIIFQIAKKILFLGLI